MIGTKPPLAPLALFVTMALAPRVGAQAPEGLMKQDAASSGKTDVADGAFEKTPERAEEEANDTTELNLSAGGLFSQGNANSIAATSSYQFKLRRRENQLTSAAAGNLGRASGGPDEPMETTVANVQGRLRYDRFITEHVALFLGISARRDRFQGLDLRLNIDPGVAYYFIDAQQHQLWVEVGYDLQHDIRRDENIQEAAAEGETVEKTATRHSGRLFAGYDNKLDERLTFTTGVEYIQSVIDTENWRLNWDAALSTTITGKLATATTISVRYDNNPLPNVRRLDTVTAISLVLTLL